MTIHWSLLVPGVLLLLFPADRLLSSMIDLRSFDGFQSLEDSPRYRPWWWVPALWLDPLRGFLGTWLLRESLALTSVRWELTSPAPYAAAVAVLAAGVVGQILTRRGDQGVLLAPVGYVAGVAAALTPWPVALIAIVTGFVGLFAFRQFHAFFAFGAATVAILGFVLETEVMWIAPAAGVFVLPNLAGLFTGSALELPTRNASRPSPPPRRAA